MIIQDKDYFSDDVKNTRWLGEVVNNEDTDILGRIKVKVFGKFDLLEDDTLPWAYPSHQISAGSITGSGSYSIPKVGSIVNVYFDNGNIYSPIYTYQQTINEDLKTEIGEDIQDFHSIIYDTELEGGLKIFYSQNEEKGLILNLKDTIINIRNDNEIKITNPNEDSISLKNDGTLEITTSTSITINTQQILIESGEKIEINTDEAIVNMNTGEVNANELTVNSNETTVNSNTTIVNGNTVDVNAASINLGEGAAEALVKGNTFLTYFNTHMHVGNLGAPSGPPIAPMTPAQLSTISKTK